MSSLAVFVVVAENWAWKAGKSCPGGYERQGGNGVNGVSPPDILPISVRGVNGAMDLGRSGGGNETV